MLVSYSFSQLLSFFFLIFYLINCLPEFAHYVEKLTFVSLGKKTPESSRLKVQQSSTGIAEELPSCYQILVTAAKWVQEYTNIICSSLYLILILTQLCHSMSPLSRIHLILPFRSANPFCTPLVHFLWPPPSHLFNGRIVLMDCPEQQRDRHSCHSTFTPPLCSYPLHPSFCDRSGNMHSVLYFPLSCRPGNPHWFGKKTVSLGLTK